MNLPNKLTIFRIILVIIANYFIQIKLIYVFDAQKSIDGRAAICYHIFCNQVMAHSPTQPELLISKHAHTGPIFSAL